MVELLEGQFTDKMLAKRINPHSQKQSHRSRNLVELVVLSSITAACADKNGFQEQLKESPTNKSRQIIPKICVVNQSKPAVS